MYYCVTGQKLSSNCTIVIYSHKYLRMYIPYLQTTQLEMQKGASQIKGAKVTIPQVVRNTAVYIHGNVLTKYNIMCIYFVYMCTIDCALMYSTYLSKATLPECDQLKYSLIKKVWHPFRLQVFILFYLG